MKADKDLGQEEDRLKGIVKEESNAKQAEVQVSATTHSSS